MGDSIFTRRGSGGGAGGTELIYTSFGSNAPKASINSGVILAQPLTASATASGVIGNGNHIICVMSYSSPTNNQVYLLNKNYVRTNLTNMSYTAYRSDFVIKGDVLNNEFFVTAANSNALAVVFKWTETGTRSELSSRVFSTEYTANTTTGNSYVIYAGGYIPSNGLTGNNVAVYNIGGTRSFASTLTINRYSGLGANFANYGLIIGGQSPNGETLTIEVYSNTLVKSSTSNTTVPYSGYSQTGIINNRILIMGNYSSNIIDVYNNTLVKQTSVYGSATNATGLYTKPLTVGKHLIIPGWVKPYSGSFDFVDTFNETLVRSFTDNLPIKRHYSVSHVFNNKGVLLGGHTSSASGAIYEQTTTVQEYTSQLYYNVTTPSIPGFTFNYNYSFNELGNGTVQAGSVLSQNIPFTGKLTMPGNIT